MTGSRECPLVDERLPRLLEHDLPAGELLLVRAHLDDCEHCAAALDDLRAITDAIVADRPDSATLAAALRRAGEGLALQPATPRRKRVAAAIATTAILLSLLALVGPPGGSALDALRGLPGAFLARVAPVARALPIPYFLAPDAEPSHR